MFLKQEVPGSGFMNLENRMVYKNLRGRFSADSSFVALMMVNSPTFLENLSKSVVQQDRKDQCDPCEGLDSSVWWRPGKS